MRDAFRAAVLVAYKPGGYGINGLSYFSEGGFLRVPFKSASGAITEREYAFGAFHHGASSEIPARNGVSNASLAMVWDRVRAALRTWDNPFTGSISQFGSSCSGTAGMPRHSGTGTPQISAIAKLGDTVYISGSWQAAMNERWYVWSWHPEQGWTRLAWSGKQGEGEVTANPDWFPRTLAIVGVRWVEDHYEEAP